MNFQWHEMKNLYHYNLIYVYSKIETTSIPSTVATTVPAPTGSPGPPLPPGNRNILEFVLSSTAQLITLTLDLRKNLLSILYN